MNEEVKVELETDAKSLSTDPYACVIKAKHSYFIGWKIVEHIPREISRYIYFFIKEGNGKVFGALKSLRYKCHEFLLDDWEVPLSLTLSRKEKWVIDIMKEFVENFYSFE